MPPGSSDSFFWRDLRKPAPRLHIGVALPGPAVPSWIPDLLELLASEPAFSLTVFETATPGPGTSPAWLFQKLQKPEVLVPWRTQLPQLHSSPDDFRHADLDVLVWLDSMPSQTDCSGWARYGVWTIASGGALVHPGTLSFWSEVRDRQPVTEAALLRHDRSFGRAEVLATHTASTQQGWNYARNKQEPLQGISALLFEALLALPERPASPQIATVSDRLPGPGNLETAAFALRQIDRSISRRLWARGRSASWFSAFRRNPERFTHRNETFDPSGFEDLPSPPGHGLADPFPLNWRGKDWVFVEEIPPDGKGRLAAACIDGRPELTPLLERNYHLSYPLPIVSGNDLFLLPESALDNTVQLFRCRRGSFEEGDAWQLEKVLYSGCLLVDTTPFFHEGKWYFFTTRVESGPHMFLFVADRLDGAWTYHPRNPISTDVRSARSAGALFWRGKRLIRPLQDCSVRYGYAIVLKEITTLSPREFEEHTIEVILPNWRPGLLATHTLNANANIEVIDGLRFSA